MLIAEPSTPSVFLLHGMKRSGNHALVRWLLPQIDGTFVNNAIPIGPILRGVETMPDPAPFIAWQASRPELRKEKPGGKLLVGLEDLELSVSPWQVEGVRMHRLLILRRPEQMFSSRVRHASRVEMVAFPKDNNHVMQRVSTVWKQHARCFLGLEDTYPGRVAISFEAWVTCRDYRHAISEALGLVFDDSAFGKVGLQGGGSSFDGMAYEGRGHEMNVLDRVSQLKAPERAVLDEIFLDTELRELSEAVHQADPFKLLTTTSPHALGDRRPKDLQDPGTPRSPAQSAP
ncbi:hypothetical protein [Marilutibacter alkalisoli]|uniref:Sulfotransferase family protein n=1 Tax=Marilutibacter alkalisoli TaxID=2591633 RepID=A0A514BUK4_9GAMM|nr:hypothetical protein [Lysobacter alkalisoli]QDH70995.1 hypothetical protein FKV23_13550 [Lysobacter alkalisoli]